MRFVVIWRDEPPMRSSWKVLVLQFWECGNEDIETGKIELYLGHNRIAMMREWDFLPWLLFIPRRILQNIGDLISNWDPQKTCYALNLNNTGLAYHWFTRIIFLLSNDYIWNVINSSFTTSLPRSHHHSIFYVSAYDNQKLANGDFNTDK